MFYGGSKEASASVVSCCIGNCFKCVSFEDLIKAMLGFRKILGGVEREEKIKEK